MKRNRTAPPIAFSLILLSAGLLPAVDAYPEPFSFAVLADPHIDGNAEHEATFRAAVQWIVINQRFTGVELVFLVGDVAYGTSGGHSNLETAKAILDPLNEAGIPYVPLLGDNEVHSGYEDEFDFVFGEQYGYLSMILDNWQQTPTPISGMYLQNFSFDYKGCHFVCPDFVSRAPGDEAGELHDFPGGSWPWFVDDIASCAKPQQENIVILTHIGMFRTGYAEADQYLFSEVELTQITDFLGGYRDYVAANYAGHIHQNWSWPVPWEDPMYHVYVTDETWYDARFPELSDNDITVRWVYADTAGPTILYTQHLEDAPLIPQTVPLRRTTALLFLLLCGAAAIAIRRLRSRAA